MHGRVRNGNKHVDVFINTYNDAFIGCSRWKHFGFGQRIARMGFPSVPNVFVTLLVRGVFGLHVHPIGPRQHIVCRLIDRLFTLCIFDHCDKHSEILLMME